MAYVPVPKDLSKIKTKVAFNLTKRQIICLRQPSLWDYRFSFAQRQRGNKHGGICNDCRYASLLPLGNV